MRISDWSSDVCSSDLKTRVGHRLDPAQRRGRGNGGRDAQARHRDRLAFEPRGLKVEQHVPRRIGEQIGKNGRAAWRERGWQYVEISVVDVSLKKKKITRTST